LTGRGYNRATPANGREGRRIFPAECIHLREEVHNPVHNPQHDPQEEYFSAHCEEEEVKRMGKKDFCSQNLSKEGTS
jgi:hypothetical protein